MRLIIILIFITNVIFGQRVINVTFDTIQNIEWSISISLRQAYDSNRLEYPSYKVIHCVLKIDIHSNIISLSYGNIERNVNITKYVKGESDYLFEYSELNMILPGKVLFTKKVDDTYMMIVQYPVSITDSKLFGYLSKTIKISIN